NSETLVIRHSDDGCLTIPRESFNADLFGIHGFVGLEIIQGAAGTPCPCAQRTPVIHLSRLALVAQADDALRQTRPVVGLNADGSDDRIAPSPGKNLSLPARCTGTWGSAAWRARTRPGKPEFHDHRHGAGSARWCRQRQLD